MAEALAPALAAGLALAAALAAGLALAAALAAGAAELGFAAALAGAGLLGAAEGAVAAPPQADRISANANRRLVLFMCFLGYGIPAVAGRPLPVAEVFGFAPCLVGLALAAAVFEPHRPVFQKAR